MAALVGLLRFAQLVDRLWSPTKELALTWPDVLRRIERRVHANNYGAATSVTYRAMLDRNPLD